MTPELLSAWGAGQVLHPLKGGARSRVWRVRVGREDFAARNAGLNEPGARWQVQTQEMARRAGLHPPRLHPCADGRLSVGGWFLETWLDGVSGNAGDVAALAPSIRRFHRLTRGWRRRPDRSGAAGAYIPSNLLVATRKMFSACLRTAVHGDIHAGNVLRCADGRLALIDWDEARTDSPAVDEIAFSTPGAPRDLAHAAAETAACWSEEPARARAMARKVRHLVRTGLIPPAHLALRTPRTLP
ncbi:MAG: phosphotransferase [Paracoccaceae bacterium]|nr:phosphotransferase [Paracoccaceae bacterium]